MSIDRSQYQPKAGHPPAHLKVPVTSRVSPDTLKDHVNQLLKGTCS